MEKNLQMLMDSLKWPWEKVAAGEEMPGPACDPVEKKHFFLVSEQDEAGDNELLACFCHAHLAETVHPLFSSVLAESGDFLPEEVFRETVWPALCISRVWFADAMAARLFPEEGRKGTEGKIRFIDNSFPEGQLDGRISDLLEMALVFAEGRSFCGIRRESSGKIQEMVEAFLEADPLAPSLEALTRLNNRLLAVWSPFRVEITRNEELGMELWKVV